MDVTKVEFFSGGQKIRALWCRPDGSTQPMPAIVQGPGWLGIKDTKDYRRYYEGFTAGGFGVLSIDYRGFGESEGERGVVSPANQLEDLTSAVTYLGTRDDVLPEAIGAYATGGTGGGNVVLLAATDPRVRAVVSQYPVADGRDWLHRMRSEYDWVTFLAALDEDRAQRVLTGVSRLVDPRTDIMIPTPERAASGFKSDVDAPPQVPLAMVDPLLWYRPVDAAAGLRTPLMVVTVENDATTPTDHARAIYDAAAGPKKLLIQRHVGHYTAYARYAGVVIPQIVDWFGRYLRPPGDIVTVSDQV
jgi:dienelactone hydrolase